MQATTVAWKIVAHVERLSEGHCIEGGAMQTPTAHRMQAGDVCCATENFLLIVTPIAPSYRHLLGWLKPQVIADVAPEHKLSEQFRPK